MTKAPQAVVELVERFQHNLDQYRDPSYNETLARRDFIDPFFVALGWDVDNRAGHAFQYREVVHEDSVKIKGHAKAPDYCFKVGPKRVFFVEAKKPAVNIESDISPAYQLRSYAWNLKLSLSILTDFEGFSVYDTRYKPQADDAAAVARVFYCRYDEYVSRWDEIAGVFSRDAVWRGDLDRFAQSTKAKRGTQEVDDAFLEEIERWRLLLARNIALRNAGLSRRELNYAVQRTIDRLIFLRICEDRQIEPDHQLYDIAQGKDIYARLIELFLRADDRFNSGLFHLKEEGKQASKPDTITPTLAVDDKTLVEIIESAYYPRSPYRFDVLAAHVLGSVYERFLGSVIRLTAGHQAKVEQKPEVRKAGGVYYTPKYIVDYIVEHTVGALCADKTPGQVARLRILDPACGSGSFLLGAYEYLLNWHLNWYVDHPTAQARKEIYAGQGERWFLTTEEKKRILLNNIYGVDIDSQAVEVTKLSLLIKLLEGDDSASVGRQMSFWEQRVLPDLHQNIKCGNSLIGPDYYDSQQLSLGFDEEEAYRINAFDWGSEFAEIMGAGGFDAVIGNPPYIRIQALKEWAPKEVEFYKQRYVSASKGNYDIYVVFVEKGLSLLNEQGQLGFILPHKFFNAQYGEPVRRLLAEGRHLAQVVHFGDQQVFTGATTYTCLMFLNKAGSAACHVQKVSDLEGWRRRREAVAGNVPAERISEQAWNFVVGSGADLFHRLDEMPVKLGDVADIFVGLQTSADAVLVLELVREDADSLKLSSKALGREVMLEKQVAKPLVSGTDVCRYAPLPNRQYILFPYEVSSTVKLIDFRTLRECCPRTADYLVENRAILQGREKGRAKGPNWYGYIYLKNMKRQGVRKLCVPRLVDHLYAAYDIDGSHFLDNVDVGGVTLRTPFEEHGLPYLLGLLNSRLLRWFFPFVSAPFRGGWYSANRQFLSLLPIRTIDFNDPADVARHDQMVSLVECMLDLHKRLAAARLPGEKTLLQRQIEATDRQIDRLVYALYDLTAEEIRIVEEAQG